MLEGQSFLSIGPGGSSRSLIRKGDFIVSAEKLADGFLIQSTIHARSSIEKPLKKEGLIREDIENSLLLFDQAPENIKVDLSPTLQAVKWEIKM